MTVVLHALKWTLSVPVGWLGVSATLAVAAWFSGYVVETAMRSREPVWWKEWALRGAVTLASVGLAWYLTNSPLFGEDAVVIHWAVYIVWAAIVGGWVRSKLRE